MTLEELYSKMGGNYARAKQIMKMDKMIDKYVRKLKSSGIGEKLAEASETMDSTALFESAHSMKGVCGNLGLDDLAKGAEEITEEFRPGTERRMTDEEASAKVTSVLEKYRYTLECIEEYESAA